MNLEPSLIRTQLIGFPSFSPLGLIGGGDAVTNVRGD